MKQPEGQEVREFYDRAKESLRYDLLKFDQEETNVVACGLADCITEHRYTCYAAAIMPDHAHLIIRKHKHSAEEVIENFQLLSRERLVCEGCRGHGHPVWTVGGWKRFLDRPAAVRRVIRYIEQNPLEIGLSRQRWPFVTLYDDWPLHPGHSPNSPYARRLRAC